MRLRGQTQRMEAHGLTAGTRRRQRAHTPDALYIRRATGAARPKKTALGPSTSSPTAGTLSVESMSHRIFSTTSSERSSNETGYMCAKHARFSLPPNRNYRRYRPVYA